MHLVVKLMYTQRINMFVIGKHEGQENEEHLTTESSSGPLASSDIYSSSKRQAASTWCNSEYFSVAASKFRFFYSQMASFLHVVSEILSVCTSTRLALLQFFWREIMFFLCFSRSELALYLDLKPDHVFFVMARIVSLSQCKLFIFKTWGRSS